MDAASATGATDDGPPKKRARTGTLTSTTKSTARKPARARRTGSKNDSIDADANLSEDSDDRLDRLTAEHRKDQAKKRKEEKEARQAEEVFHFVGYVPYAGRVWELDGLREFE
jgi:hypothetical protein